MWRRVMLIGLVGCSPAAPVAEGGTTPPEVPPSPPPTPMKPTPIDGSLPAIRGALATRTSCAASRCATPTPPPPGEAPAVLWSQQLAAGAAVTFPRRPETTLFGVVLEGEVRLETTNGTDGIADWPAPRWHAFRAPEGELRIQGVRDTHLVLALSTGGAPLSGTHPADEDLSPHPRSAMVQVVDVASRDDLSWAGGSAHARIVFDDGRASLQLLLASPSSTLPPHRHPTSWEQIGLFEVAGTFLHDGTPEPVSAGATLAIAPGVEHGFTPDGTSRMVGVQLYVPPGPEQRFRALAER